MSPEEPHHGADGDAGPTAIVAEDESLLADELVELLATLWPTLQVRAIVHDGAAALQSVETHAPDIAFLDIHMPRLTGLDVARRVHERCHVVFISAFDQHAIEAFEAGGIDYVLKPLSASRLLTTIDRLKVRLGRDADGRARAVQHLPLPAPAAPPSYLQWINASQGAAVRLITVGEILYFRADNKVTLVITRHGESVIRRTIRELGDQLDPTTFWQVHRSTIVNVHAIDRLLRDSRGNLSICLRGRDETLPVSSQYQALFRQM